MRKGRYRSRHVQLVRDQQQPLCLQRPELRRAELRVLPSGPGHDLQSLSVGRHANELSELRHDSGDWTFQSGRHAAGKHDQRCAALSNKCAARSVLRTELRLGVHAAVTPAAGTTITSATPAVSDKRSGPTSASANVVSLIRQLPTGTTRTPIENGRRNRFARSTLCINHERNDRIGRSSDTLRSLIA